MFLVREFVILSCRIYHNNVELMLNELKIYSILYATLQRIGIFLLLVSLLRLDPIAHQWVVRFSIAFLFGAALFGAINSILVVRSSVLSARVKMS